MLGPGSLLELLPEEIEPVSQTESFARQDFTAEKIFSSTLFSSSSSSTSSPSVTLSLSGEASTGPYFDTLPKDLFGKCIIALTGSPQL
jgi:hypothetical protein